MRDEVAEDWPDDDDDTDNQGPAVVAKSDRVFIVHGRDAAKPDISAFVDGQGLKPVILSDQPSGGKTVIEKVEEYGDVGYAIVLLTPDDEGRLRDSTDSQKPRARQNVVFELGYFIGRLGREYVCALTKGELELPSDYAGVVYIPYGDSTDWKARLMAELRSAGYTVDPSKLLPS